MDNIEGRRWRGRRGRRGRLRRRRGRRVDIIYLLVEPCRSLQRPHIVGKRGRSVAEGAQAREKADPLLALEEADVAEDVISHLPRLVRSRAQLSWYTPQPLVVRRSSV